METKKVQLTTEEKIEFVKGFILLHEITNEDVKQELYLSAIEFDGDEFSTKERKLSMLSLVLDEVYDDSSTCEKVRNHIERPIGFMDDIDLIASLIFGR